MTPTASSSSSRLHLSVVLALLVISLSIFCCDKSDSHTHASRDPESLASKQLVLAWASLLVILRAACGPVAAIAASSFRASF